MTYPQTIKGMRNKDEHYILDICDEVLKVRSSRQHRFPFLLGDIGKNGNTVKLPVDAYYQELNLVIEYKEKQHTENVKHFDKPDKITVSGVHRGEQRKIYDQRRLEILPKHGIYVIELFYSDFKHNSSKRLIRNLEQDKEVVAKKLSFL